MKKQNLAETLSFSAKSPRRRRTFESREYGSNRPGSENEILARSLPPRPAWQQLGSTCSTAAASVVFVRSSKTAAAATADSSCRHVCDPKDGGAGEKERSRAQVEAGAKDGRAYEPHYVSGRVTKIFYLIFHKFH